MGLVICSMGVVVDDNRILLIKRIKSPFIGLWSIPSGKIELGEHIEETAVREMKEETDIDAEFRNILGVVSEHIYEKKKLWGHFILFLCRLKPKHKNHRTMKEGDVEWFDLNKIDEQRDLIVPSDYLMIKNMVLQKKGHIFRSVIEKSGEKYNQKIFEAV